MSPARLVVLSFLAASLTLLVTVSCGGGKGQCNSASCNGCCDSSFVCQPGVGIAACGVHGQVCSTCTRSETCSLGACVPGSGNGGGTAASGGGSTSSGGGHATGGGTSSTGGSSGTGGGGGAGVCSTDNCNGGCCDVFGACQTSNTEHCGTLGADCQACGNTQTCDFGNCAGGTGGGGGAGGGGAGGGTAPGCATLSLNGGTTVGAVDDSSESVALTHLTTTTPNEVTYELWWTNSPTLPHTENFSSASKWFTCDGCITYRENCTSATATYPFADCTGRGFFAQSGSLTITSANETSPGGIAGSSHSVVLQEWNFTTDVRVDGGTCLALPDSSFSVTF